MNYCGQPFAHASNPLAVCGMIDPKRVYQCDQCAALSGQTCSHGQLKRVCRECELEAEIEALRAQVAAYATRNERLEAEHYVPGEWHCPKCNLVLLASAMSAVNGQMYTDDSPQQCANGCGPMWRVTERQARILARKDYCDTHDKLADCRAVLRERGHEIWCGSNNCGHLYAGGFCGIGRDAHGPNGAVHEFIARHKCTCGYDRVMGEG